MTKKNNFEYRLLGCERRELWGNHVVPPTVPQNFEDYLVIHHVVYWFMLLIFISFLQLYLRDSNLDFLLVFSSPKFSK